MGCKKELEIQSLPFNIEIERIQSITVTADMSQVIHLAKLKELLGSYVSYNPEIFPALRLEQYNPICVNVFSSGKIVFLGIKTLDFNHFVNQVTFFITSCLFFI
jgi:TATA-box binding protein (TBP) (component of TFIID and TFIIIB)